MKSGLRAKFFGTLWLELPILPLPLMITVKADFHGSANFEKPIIPKLAHHPPGGDRGSGNFVGVECVCDHQSWGGRGLEHSGQSPGRSLTGGNSPQAALHFPGGYLRCHSTEI